MTLSGPRIARIQPDDDTSWQPRARCLGSAVDFHPSPTDAAGIQIAKDFCAACPVALPCLQYALAIRDGHAICGGTTPNERDRMLRRLRS